MKGVNLILKGVAKELNIQPLKEFGQIGFYNEAFICDLYCFSLHFVTHFWKLGSAGAAD